ncbi:MAG TPA: copper-binding protein [Thermoanaerobaculia bacterium]|nr:copper-binding protein [Thermoanaerobaculia bacterium]
MWRLLPLSLAILCAACSEKSGPPPKENIYPMTATIVSRDRAQNSVNLDNREVPGVMEAMKMDYQLRGAKVDSLPPDGTAVDVKLHERDGRYWVTDVKPVSANAAPARR